MSDYSPPGGAQEPDNPSAEPQQRPGSGQTGSGHDPYAAPPPSNGGSSGWSGQAPPPPPAPGGDDQAPPPAYGQAPPPPAYGQAPPPEAYGQAPGAVARPKTMDNAVRLMQAGGVIALIGLVISLLDRSAIREAIEKAQPTFTTSQVDAAVTTATVFAVIFGLIGAGLWFWMAAVNGKGRKWGRILATIFFVISVLSAIYAFSTPGAALSKILGIVQFLVGAAAIYFMYRKESTEFYNAASAPR